METNTPTQSVVSAPVFFTYAFLVLICLPARVRAQETEAVEFGPTQESADTTRLDVERLPPDFVDVTRDMYSHGFFIDGRLGARFFTGTMGQIATPGFLASIGLGYEAFRWLYFKVSAEMSIHGTHAPPPPDTTAFEILGGVAELGIQGNISSRVALSIAGQLGLMTTTGDVLRAFGLPNADAWNITYGGEAGFDYHLRNRHNSVGIAGGARMYPSLADRAGNKPLGIQSVLYIRHVF